MHWFVIMICRSGRHRSVANDELWSNTLTRCSRHQHSVSLLHLSELDIWENTCARNCSECSKQCLRVFQTHYDKVQAECLRRVPVPDPVTVGNDCNDSTRRVQHDSFIRKTTLRKLRKKKKNKRQVPQPHLSRRARVGEPWTNWQNDSGTFTTAPVHWRLQIHDVSRKTDQGMIEAAKCLFHKLLGEASDDLERVTPRSLEMPSENCVWRTSTDTPMPQSSAESSEHVVEDDPRKQLEFSVPRYEPGEWEYEFQMSSSLHRNGAKRQDSKFSDVHLTWIRRLECRQAVS